MTDVSLPQTMIFGHLWQSVALAAVLAGVLILGKRMRGATRYSLAAAAFVASLALPLAAFIPGETIVAGLLKQLNAPVSLANSATIEVVMPVQPVVPASPMVMPTVFEQGAAPVSAIVTPPAAPAAPAEPVAAHIATKTYVPLFTVPEIKLPELGLPLLAIWFAGAVFLLARTGRDLIAVEQLVARAKPADLPEALKRRMQGVRVVVSPEAPGPMAAGLFKPAIVLPESIALASPGMAALLEHEHAHIRRHDMLAALGQRVVLALMWWSPALYWMSRRLDEEREVACDEAAVDRTGDAKAFARSLTTQAENQLWVRAPKLAVGAIGPRSQFGRRIKRLIDLAKTGGHPAKYSGRLAFAGLALTVAVAAMVTPRFTAEAQSPDSKGAIDLTSPKPGQQAMIDEQRSNELDGRGPGDFDFQWEGQNFAGLGDEINELMSSMIPELEMALSGLSPELQADLTELSVEMAALGAEISASVNDEVMREMPVIMEEVRRSLQEAGIDPDNMDQWQSLEGFDGEELRQTLQEAREEMRATLGPQLQAEIRAALDQAREEVASHREEIAAAVRESHDGMAIAREAMAAARAEIEAARARGDFDRIKFDLDRSRHGYSALYEAADDCDVAELNRLIGEKKQDINSVMPGQGTALMAAADSNCTDAARALINAGANVNLGFPGAGTPLSVAAENNAMPIAQLLLNRGADVNAYVAGDDTPLVKAAREGDLGMVKLLVEKGADVNLASRPGSSIKPLKMAERHGNDEIAAYLRANGAVPETKSAN
ncbi:MAG: M56 family metallopeptidase [Hyphomonadaceae bacterium]|nr:M56 family metallopeptidase [Hyphomonadaceae bacterium]